MRMGLRHVLQTTELDAVRRMTTQNKNKKRKRVEEKRMEENRFQSRHIKFTSNIIAEERYGAP